MKKIAIPTDNNVSISKHFGTAKWFKVIEVEDNHVSSFRYVENKAGDSNGQTHLDVMEKLKDCEVIIARDMGAKMQEELQSMNKKIIITNEVQMDLAVESYIKDFTKSN